MDECPRHLERQVAAALEVFRVVVVTGPRQAGKTTLVRRVLGGGGTFSRLDDEATLQAALQDPAAFAAYGETPRAIDEVQRGGDALIRAIKAEVDIERRPGQYLLNGSADFLTVPSLSESLAGRAAFFELWPFSQGEIDGAPDGFLDLAFREPDALATLAPSALRTEDYVNRCCRGGFPEVIELGERMRSLWYRNYVRSVAQRDIVELTGARRSDQIPKLLSLVAARTAGELVLSHLHDEAGLGARVTTDDYLAYLEMTYLVARLPAWSRNLSRKVTRHPKVHVTDSGLAAHLLGASPASLARPTDAARGALLETFVYNELRRQVPHLDPEVRLYHLRDRDGAEVDLVAEAADGRLVAVEVKASQSVSARDARWLAWLRDRAGGDFVHGVVLYTGERPVRLGDRVTAVPMSALWQAGQMRPPASAQ